MSKIMFVFALVFWTIITLFFSSEESHNPMWWLF